MAGRGRPKGSTSVNTEEKKMKFTRTFIDKYTGLKSKWVYDLNITDRGPISVEHFYPNNYKSYGEINDALPPTKRTYTDPETQKEIGYGRAKAKGII